MGLLPFLPQTAKRVLGDLSVEIPSEFGNELTYGKSVENAVITKGDALFMRINIEKELVEMEKLGNPEQKKEEPKQENKEKKKEEKKMKHGQETYEEIVIDDFAKVELKVGKILTAEKVEGSKKLLHFSVDTRL